MNELSEEVFNQIKEWVESGKWKNQPYGYDENRQAFYIAYSSPWFTDLTDEEYENINWDDEQDHYSFLIRIYIWEDCSYKLEFDPGLFHLIYRGYDTEEDRNAWQEFKDLAKQKGLLLE